MALIAVNDRDQPDGAALKAALGSLPPGAPIVIMAHGFRYSPSAPAQNPHRHILSLDPDRRSWGAISWPRRLGFGGDQGLAIAYGWESRCSIWQAHARAAVAGRRLAALIGLLRQIDPDRPLHIIAHSLGARVALTALAQVEAGTVGRVLLIAAAAHLSEARAAMASPGGRTAEVINVLARENRLFDLLLLAVLPYCGRTLGRGHVDARGWLDLPIDRGASLAGLHALGWRIAPSRVAICHWSGYLRPGVWSLYRALLQRPAETPLAVLRAATAPVARTWGLAAVLPLQSRRHTPS